MAGFAAGADMTDCMDGEFLHNFLTLGDFLRLGFGFLRDALFLGGSPLFGGFPSLLTDRHDVKSKIESGL